MSQPNSHQFPCTGPIEAFVKLGGGEVHVSAEETDTATVEVIPNDDGEAARTAAANTSVQFTGGRLRVEAPDGKGFVLRRSGRIRIHLRVPLDSGLSVQSGSADLRVDGRIGRTEVHSGSGDAYVRTTSGDLLVATGSGDIRSDAVGGEVRATSGSGDVTITLAEGPVQAGTGSGDISIEESRSVVRVTTASGDVRIGLVGTGDVKVNTASGDVNVGVAAGTGVWLDLNTVSGQARSNLDVGATPVAGGNQLTLRVNTVSGDIMVNRVGPARPAAPAPSAAQPAD